MLSEPEEICEKITSNEGIMDALGPPPVFKSREEIKPWIYSKLHKRGIHLVIERSDTSKVVFKCKNIHKKSVNCALANSSRSGSLVSIASIPTNNGKKTKSASASSSGARSSPEQTCPFRLRVSHSVKNKQWIVTITKHEHNALVCCNFGDPVLQAQYNISSPSSNTPGSIGSKRSYTGANSSTPNSIVSPALSNMSTNSPATSIFTPTSETFDMDIYSNQLKRQKTGTKANYLESPLYREVNPVDDLSSQHDFKSMDGFFPPSNDNNDLMNFAVCDLDSQLNFSHIKQDIDQQFDDILSVDPRPANTFSTNDNYGGIGSNVSLNIFDNEIQKHTFDFKHELTPILESSVSPQIHLDTFLLPQQNQNIFKQHIKDYGNTKCTKPESISTSNPQHLHSTPLQLQSTLNLQQPTPQLQTQFEAETPFSMNVSLPSYNSKNDDTEDPITYLLSAASSSANNASYTLEELEDLDRAMGFDANDQYLMSMFQDS